MVFPKCNLFGIICICINAALYIHNEPAVDIVIFNMSSKFNVLLIDSSVIHNRRKLGNHGIIITINVFRL